MNNNSFKIIAVMAIIVAVAAMAVAVWSTAKAQNAAVLALPSTINYQGLLRDTTGELVNGTFNITAQIYDTMGVGTSLYSTTKNDVVVRDGVFNIILGDEAGSTLSDLFINSPLYIGITLDNTATELVETEEIIPRQTLHAVPWAFIADQAITSQTAGTLIDNAQINGLTSTGSVTLSGSDSDLIVDGDLFLHPGSLRTYDGTATYPSGQFYFYNYEIILSQNGSNQLNTSNWTEFNLSNHNVPVDASAVILEARGHTNFADYDSNVYVSNGDGVWRTLMRGSGHGGLVTIQYFSGQGVFPIQVVNGVAKVFAIFTGNPLTEAGEGYQLRLLGYVR